MLFDMLISNNIMQKYAESNSKTFNTYSFILGENTPTNMFFCIFFAYILLITMLFDVI